MMAKGMAALIILLQVCFVSLASADEVKPTPENKRDYKWVYFAALPVYYFGVEIPLHEGTHGLAAAISPSYDVTGFKPYMHYDAKQGAFLFGSVTMECSGGGQCPDKAALGKIYLAPYIVTSALFVTSDVLLATEAVDPTSVSGRVLYFAGMAAPWLDFTYNTIWPRDISDNAQIAENFEMPRSSVIAKGAIISAAGAWRLWSGYKRAFPKHSRVKASESGLVILPMSNTETVGLSVHMSF